MPLHQGLRTDDRDGPEDRWEPSIQRDQEQAIPIGNYVSVAVTESSKDIGRSDDPPPLKWSDLRYVFDIQEDCNGKEAIQA